jgi:hypothetical protein
MKNPFVTENAVYKRNAARRMAPARSMRRRLTVEKTRMVCMMTANNSIIQIILRSSSGALGEFGVLMFLYSENSAYKLPEFCIISRYIAKETQRIRMLSRFGFNIGDVFQGEDEQDAGKETEEKSKYDDQ